ncbi:MAG: nucleotide exchange factor GrpE [Thermoleophilia bacterium]
MDKHTHQRGPAPKKDTSPESEAPTAGASDQKVAEISAQMAEELRRERDEYLEALQRLQAEFANFRKRVLRESEQAGQRASTQMIAELLPVLDNFERAIQAAAEHDQEVLSGGVELVYNQLRDVLVKRGLCEIDAHGQPFDPNQHEAILCQPSAEHEEGTVMQVIEKGYQLEDRVVRPAKVIVSKDLDAGRDEGGKD